MNEETALKKISIFTDGACSGNPGRGGLGAVLLYNGHRKEISEGYLLTTNNRMELLSVIRALEMLKEPCEIEIFSDSKYVVDAIEKGWVYKWKKNNWMRTKTDKALNPDLWKRLLESLERNNVKFIWVKGHASNKENNRCDELARGAIENGDTARIDEGFGKQGEKP
jgi:ribonuclease HI